MAKKPKEDAPDTGEADEGKEKGRKFALPSKKVMIIGGAGLAVLLIAGGAAAYFLGLFSKKKVDAKGTPEQIAAAAATPQKAAKLPHFIELPEMTVNLLNSGPKPQFLRMKVALELADAALAPQVQPLLPRVVDSFQVYMREMRPGDLEGSAGVQRLKEELTRRVNLAIQPVKVESVLFKELLVQ
jgi:flagellar FliL protein